MTHASRAQWAKLACHASHSSPLESLARATSVETSATTAAASWLGPGSSTWRTGPSFSSPQDVPSVSGGAAAAGIQAEHRRCESQCMQKGTSLATAATCWPLARCGNRPGSGSRPRRWCSTPGTPLPGTYACTSMLMMTNEQFYAAPVGWRGKLRHWQPDCMVTSRGHVNVRHLQAWHASTIGDWADTHHRAARGCANAAYMTRYSSDRTHVPMWPKVSSAAKCASLEWSRHSLWVSQTIL